MKEVAWTLNVQILLFRFTWDVTKEALDKITFYLLLSYHLYSQGSHRNSLHGQNLWNWRIVGPVEWPSPSPFPAPQWRNSATRLWLQRPRGLPWPWWLGYMWAKIVFSCLTLKQSLWHISLRLTSDFLSQGYEYSEVQQNDNSKDGRSKQ